MLDRISEMAQVKPSEALSVLLALELKDQARQLSGMRFVRKVNDCQSSNCCDAAGTIENR